MLAKENQIPSLEEEPTTQFFKKYTPSDELVCEIIDALEQPEDESFYESMVMKFKKTLGNYPSDEQVNLFKETISQEIEEKMTLIAISEASNLSSPLYALDQPIELYSEVAVLNRPGEFTEEFTSLYDELISEWSLVEEKGRPCIEKLLGEYFDQAHINQKRHWGTFELRGEELVMVIDIGTVIPSMFRTEGLDDSSEFVDFNPTSWSNELTTPQ